MNSFLFKEMRCKFDLHMVYIVEQKMARIKAYSSSSAVTKEPNNSLGGRFFFVVGSFPQNQQTAFLICRAGLLPSNPLPESDRNRCLGPINDNTHIKINSF
jgi:hypothetical protein